MEYVFQIAVKKEFGQIVVEYFEPETKSVAGVGPHGCVGECHVNGPRTRPHEAFGVSLRW